MTNKYWKEIKKPTDISKLNSEEILKLIRSVRDEIIDFTNSNGGHLGSQLGAVEIILSLFNNFDFKKDKVFFDINDQVDTYKLLTGQKLDPKKHLLEFEDSKIYNHWTAGHTSTALSGALGAAKARDIKGKKHEIISVVGDASFWSGMNMEAFSNAVALDTKIITILNDNNFNMEPIDGFWTQLSQTLGIPGADKIHKNILDSNKFELIGPLDGNNFESMDKALKYAKSIKENKHILIWAKTTKGLSNDGKIIEWSHWVSKDYLNNEINISTDIRKYVFPKDKPDNIPQFLTWHFDKLLSSKKNREKLAIYAPSVFVMWPGLQQLIEKYPDNCWNTQINEEFSATFGAGLSLNGVKPIMLVGSTFSQRAYDQFIHDVARQEQPMLLILNNTGLDTTISETHQAMFDSAMFKQLPNTEIYEPVNLDEMENIINYYNDKISNKLVVVRLKSTLPNSAIKTKNFEKWENITNKKNPNLFVIASGSVANELNSLVSKRDLNWDIINATSIKPLDKNFLKKLNISGKPIFTVEHEYRLNSLGAQINDFYNLNNIEKIVKIIAMDNNEFNTGRTVDEVLEFASLDEESIINRINKLI